MRDSNILLVYKRGEELARLLGQEIKSWLEDRHFCCALCESPLLPQYLDVEYKLAIVLGGDGTLIGVTRKLAALSLPIFGVNMGHLGFLCAADRENWHKLLEQALAEKMPARGYPALQWHIGERYSGWAVNETVVGRGTLARLVSIAIEINGENLGILRCDGLIICTPQGSAAYGASAGGSIVHPELQLSCLVPICPFPATVSPLILPANCQYRLTVAEAGQEVELTVDGQEGYSLRYGESVEIKCVPNAIHLFAGSENFLRKLEKRGFSLNRTC